MNDFKTSKFHTRSRCWFYGRTPHGRWHEPGVLKISNSNTLGHWRSFAEEHLLGSDRLVRNLYDLRQVDHLSERAIRIAVELNSDPSTRNIRLAVVVKDIAIKDAVQKISDLTPAGGARMQVFTDLARGRGLA